VREAYYVTVKELLDREGFRVPEEMQSGEHLIYSSPATLSYNSPGAQGFGVKRAGLVIPESIMLLIAPACCGRNTTILADEGGYSDRIFFLQMDESDIVTGRHLSDIPAAIQEILDVCEPKPKVVVLCITCVDALLGTDLERVCRKAEETLAETPYAGIRVVPSYMYALTREGKNPPMVAIRDTIYSLIERSKPKMNRVNLLGNFTHLEDDCELYNLLSQIGLTDIREVGRCQTLEEYKEMGDANFNLILNPEARKAAYNLDERLGIPYAELMRLYQPDRIGRQYELFAAALGTTFHLEPFRREAEAAVERMKETCSGKSFAIGQVVNGNPIEMALALSKMGFEVKAVFANLSEEDYPYIRELGEYNRDMRIYSTLSPTMMNYDGDQQVDISLGIDASFYYPKSTNVKWNQEVQPFGYRGLQHFAEAVTAAALEAMPSMELPARTEEANDSALSEEKEPAMDSALSPSAGLSVSSVRTPVSGKEGATE
jgi:nitrogenase molybdenum-cofactor synthesis protein NifE